jgi:hypothetical protein
VFVRCNIRQHHKGAADRLLLVCFTISIHRHHRSLVKMRSHVGRSDFFVLHRRTGVPPGFLSIFPPPLKKVEALFLLCSAAILVSGCEQNSLGTLDPRGTPPVLSQYSLVPSSVRLDSIRPSGTNYPITLLASAYVTDPDGADQILRVTATVTAPDGTVRLIADLHDDGKAPDKIANDGFYTGTLALNLARSDFGNYHVSFTSVDRQHREGTTVITTLTVHRPNIPPWLFNLVCPDSVAIPAHGANPFSIQVQAGDSDGIGDITGVTLKVTGGSGPPSVLQLTDDGNIANKDSIQGERYSITLQVDSSNTPRTYILLLQAVDHAGDTSATLTHPLTLH